MDKGHTDLKETYTADSPQLQGALARLQQAVYLARAPKGFDSLKHVPELPGGLDWVII